MDEMNPASDMLDSVLSEYIEEAQAQQINMDPQNDTDIVESETEDYYSRTQEYYKQMSMLDVFYAIYFTIHSSYICSIEYLKYKIGWKSKTNAIIDVSKRLSNINMMYVKIFQAFATNKNIISPELNKFFSDYTDNVEYTDDEYNYEDLIEIENNAVGCYPYKPIKILHNYKPIKSGLMSLIFKGVFMNADGTSSNKHIAVKYLRNNIINNFNTSMNNLVIFAKLTRYIPYIRTLNIETLILQNIVSLKDQVYFRKEVSNIQRYYSIWKDCDYVIIPEPYAEFTEKLNPNIIVMEFINGISITDIDPKDHDRFGKILASFSGKAAFCNSIYHGDLHPGNILFIKESETASESASASESQFATKSEQAEESTTFTYKIGILDFGIIGRLSRKDQDLLYKSTKLLYQKKYNRVIHMILSEMSEDINPPRDTSLKEIPSVQLPEDVFHKIQRELHNVIVEYSTPEIKFLGVNELYTINYILNSYNLTFKRSLYRLFITIAIMDSIATKLGSEMSYMQHMTDVVVDLFGIDTGDFVDD